MKIGIIAPPGIAVPPPAYGGIEATVDTLAREFRALGHDVLLAASADSTCPVDRVPVDYDSDPRTMGRSLEEVRHLARVYPAMADRDLVHDHTAVGPFFSGRPAGVPVVSTIHAPFDPAALDLYRRVPRDASLVAISQNQASSARGVPIAAVIHHGLDVQHVPVGAGQGGYVCFLGRMNVHKGVQEAIRIARKAGYPLLIAAKMQEKIEYEYFETAIRPELGGGVEYLGELNTADKYLLLGGAAALLNPLQWPEPFGMVMIESLATGTPVISTPRGSAPEIIEDGMTGFLRDSESDLAAAILRTGELDRAACRTTAEVRFSGRRMANDYLRLFTGLLESGLGQRREAV